MAQVRVNGQRVPPLASISVLESLLSKIDAVASKKDLFITSVSIDGKPIEMEQLNLKKITLASDEVVDVRLENPKEMAHESLQVAMELVELLVFDLKVATLRLWEPISAPFANQALSKLLDDTRLFLTLAARPFQLMDQNPEELGVLSQQCLRKLDEIAEHLQDAVLLYTHKQPKNTCRVLVARVLPALEQWMGLAPAFATDLDVAMAPPRENLVSSSF
jgi:hypothetical protein